MQITIVVEDKIVLVNRKPIHLPELDWAAFDMDPANQDDDIAAVQFDTASGTGHVEFKTRVTKQLNRPNIRPPDWNIGTKEFEENFGFVIPAYEAKLKIVQAEEARNEAEREARMKESMTRQAAAENEPKPEAPDLVTREEMEARIREASVNAAQAAASLVLAEVAKSAGGGNAV